MSGHRAFGPVRPTRSTNAEANFTSIQTPTRDPHRVRPLSRSGASDVLVLIWSSASRWSLALSHRSHARRTRRRRADPRARHARRSWLARRAIRVSSSSRARSSTTRASRFPPRRDHPRHARERPARPQGDRRSAGGAIVRQGHRSPADGLRRPRRSARPTRPRSSATTDEGGRFCFRAPLVPDRHLAHLSWRGSNLVDGAERELAFDLSRQALVLRFDPTPRIVLARHADASPSRRSRSSTTTGRPRSKPGLALVSRTRRREELAHAARDGRLLGTRALRGRRGAKLGPPGEGALRVSFAGDAADRVRRARRGDRAAREGRRQRAAAERGELEAAGARRTASRSSSTSRRRSGPSRKAPSRRASAMSSSAPRRSSAASRASR